MDGGWRIVSQPIPATSFVREMKPLSSSCLNPWSRAGRPSTNVAAGVNLHSSSSPGEPTFGKKGCGYLTWYSDGCVSCEPAVIAARGQSADAPAGWSTM